MALFSDILLTADFDRTLTAPDSSIPERNLEAIRYFMDNGGTFTMNTGRSVNTMGALLHTIPVNAPFLLYNGSAAYDAATGQLLQVKTIDLDIWETLEQVYQICPDLNLEIQGEHYHYLYKEKPEYVAMCDALGWKHQPAIPGMDVGPFMKFAIFGHCRDINVGQYFSGSQEELRQMDELEAWLHRTFAGKVEVFRAAPRIIDVHTKGISKLRCARELQKSLGKGILVCVGDAENDLSMLEGADFAFCPSDGVVADRFPNVCPCAEGAVADVIYEKIPEILKNRT